MKKKILTLLRLFTPIVVLVAAYLFFPAIKSHHAEKQAIRQTVKAQLSRYPKSTLQDLYKNFFQDCFGPGHLLSDTAAAKAYLLNELNSVLISSTSHDSIYFEATGYAHRFYRVSLWAIADSLISFDTYVDAFVRSAAHFNKYSIDEWKKEWSIIDAVVLSMNLSLPNEERDRQEIAHFLSQDQYVSHHSEIFNETYHPHYRLIERSIVEQELMPIIECSKK